MATSRSEVDHSDSEHEDLKKDNYSEVLFRHMRRSLPADAPCRRSIRREEAIRRHEESGYCVWDFYDDDRDSFVFDDATFDFREDIPEKAEEVRTGKPVSVAFSLDVVPAEDTSSEDGEERRAYDLLARPLGRGREKVRLPLGRNVAPPLGVGPAPPLGWVHHSCGVEGPQPFLLSLQRLKRSLRRCLDGESAATEVEADLQLLARAWVRDRDYSAIDSVVFIHSETGEEVVDDFDEDHVLTHVEISKLVLKYTTRAVGPTVYIWKPDELAFGTVEGAECPVRVETCSTRRVQAINERSEGVEDCWVIYQRSGVFMTRTDGFYDTCPLGVLCHTPSWPLPRFAEQVFHDESGSRKKVLLRGGTRFFSRLRGPGLGSEPQDIWTAKLPSDVRKNVKSLLDAHADATQDCPIPRYQMIIDPNLFVSTPNPETARWLPCEFDIGEVDGQCTLLGDDEAHKFPDLAQQVATPILNAAIPLLARLRRPQLVLAGQKLQVVFKAQRIIVPPGETYEGVWHIDGKNRRCGVVLLSHGPRSRGRRLGVWGQRDRGGGGRGQGSGFFLR